MPANEILTPEAIRKYRFEKKLSQKDLAFILGVGTETVSEWENGQTRIAGTSEIILRTVIMASHAGLTTDLMFGSGYIIYQLLKDVFEPLSKNNNFVSRREAF